MDNIRILNTPFKYIIIVAACLTILCSRQTAYSLSFSDDFSSGALQWTPISGAWKAEDGEYRHKESGISYPTENLSPLFSDDFSAPNPTIVTTSVPFTDSFNVANGPAPQWSVKRGTFAISGNEYFLYNGGTTLSIPSNSEFNNWTSSRITARIKRNGTTDSYGYSIIYFRLTMVNATQDNSYAIIFRQTGTAEVWKRSNGSFINSLGSFSIPKDNIWHNVILLVSGTSLKVWFDKSENSASDLFLNNLTDYSQGTIGVGTQAWDSVVDDIQVESVSYTYRWFDKYGSFNIQNGVNIANALTSNSSISIPADSNFSALSDYKITAKIKRNGAINTTGYAIIYFRLSNINATQDNSYAVLFRQTGKAELWQRVGGGWNKSFGSFNIPKDNDWHTVIVLVKDSAVKIWFDRTEDYSPNISIADKFTAYTSGTIGIGTSGWDSSFDEITLSPIFLVKSEPFFLYKNALNKATVSISSSQPMNDLQITVSNPDRQMWNVVNPSQCTGSTKCEVIFPDDFSGSDISLEGTYVISASTDSSAAYTLIEVREKPLFTFAQITDTHSRSGEVGQFVADINSSKFFPLPDFVVVTGDLVDRGTVSEMVSVKATLDQLTVPYYPLTGNHESWSEQGDNMGLNWANTFGLDKFTYSWINGDFLFIAMDITTPYSGYGFNYNSMQHMIWLQNTLKAHPDKKVLLFAHYLLKEVRDSGGAKDYWQGEASSLPVRQLMESHGGVIAQFAGHNHLNGMNLWNGIHYISTASFIENGEFRYVELYSDRIDIHIIKKFYYCHYDYCDILWPDSTDSSHTASIYTYGLPHERQLTIDNVSKKTAILDGITLAGNELWQDHKYEAEINLNNKQMLGENTAGLIYRYTDKNNYYSVLLNSGRNLIKLQKKQNGALTELAVVNFTVDLFTTYRIKVIVQGSRIKVYLDGFKLIDVTDTSFSSGKIGLRSYRSNTFYDNISATTDLIGSDPSGPYIGVTGHTIEFNGSSSTVSTEKNIVLYEWDINNDGTFEYSSTGPTATHVFTSPGSYVISLRVTDNEGVSDEALTFIEIAGIVLSADFTASPRIGAVPHTVEFNNLSTGPHLPLSYEWDFNNDGITDSTEEHPTYIFTDFGIYDVKLTITDPFGSISSLTQPNYISVNQYCPYPVMIYRTEPLYFSSLQSAYDASEDGDVIMTTYTDFFENLTINRNVSVLLSGGYDCEFLGKSATTAIKGIVSIQQGSIATEDFIIE